MAARKPPGTGRPQPPPRPQPAKAGPSRKHPKGNPGPKNKPKPPGPAASFPAPTSDPPKFLDDIPGANTHYAHLKQLLADRWQPHYDYGLAILAKSYAILDRWAAETARNPTTPTREGGEKTHPAAQLVKETQITIRAYETKFGLTPRDEHNLEHNPTNAAPTRPGDPAKVGAM